MKTILAATDGSAAADRAVRFAAALAASLKAKLVVLTVGQNVVDSQLKEFSQIEHASITEILDAESAAIAADARDQAARLGANNVSTRIALGDPAEEILAAAKDISTDMLVIGKRGRGRLQGLLLGSVSQKLASLAPCAVLVVP